MSSKARDVLNPEGRSQEETAFYYISMLDQYIDVYSGVRGVNTPVWVVQGDTGRVLILRLKDYTLTGTEGASLVCKRPDNTVYTYSGTVSQSANTVKFVLSNAGGALIKEGHVKAMALISKSGQTVDTYPIEIIVLPNAGGVATQAEKTFVQGLSEQLAAKANTADVVLNTRTVNTVPLTSDIVLKAQNFSEEVTGQKMLGGLSYRVLRTI